MGTNSVPSDAVSSSRTESNCTRTLKYSLGILLALLTFEGIALRYFNFEKSNDAVLGRVFRAGHTVYSRVEGNGRAHFIENAIRRACPMPLCGSPPILALGDSYTEALQVDDDEVYTAVLERMLREAGLSNPVLNHGSSGYSVVDYIELAPEMSERTGQIWSVIQVRDKDFASDAWSPRKRHFSRIPGSDSLAISGPRTDLTPPAPWLGTLYNAIALAPWTFHRMQLFMDGSRKGPRLFHAGEPAGGTNPQEMNLALDEGLYRQEMELLAKAFRRRLTLLFIAEYDPHSPFELTAEETMFVQAAEDLGLSIVNTRNAHRDFQDRQTSPYGFPNTHFNRGHLNSEGHAAAARLLAEELLRLHQNDLF